MKAKILELLIEYEMICDPDELPEIPVCDRCIQFEKELSELLNHASQTEIPTDHESQAMRDYKNTRGSVHYHHGWTACYNWIKEYINKG